MYENARIIIVGLWFVPLCSFVMLFFIAVCSGPSISGSDERGAEAALPPSTPANAVAVSNSVVGAKLGDGQALRVRLDSYPAGKWYLFHFCIKNWILSSKHFCRIRTKQDLNTSWTEGNKHFALARHSPIPLRNPCSLPKSTISGKYFCFACFLFCTFSTWTMLLPLWSNLPMWPPYHPPPLHAPPLTTPSPLPPPPPYHPPLPLLSNFSGKTWIYLLGTSIGWISIQSDSCL